jgi:hypothetical protein
MKKHFYLILAIFLIILNDQNFAQGVAINSDNTNPDPSAMLDVKSTTRGMLLPRVTQAQRTAIAAPATGLLVYQTDNPGGFYYYNGTGWFRLSLQNEGWSTTGNAGNVSADNFIGTTDNQPLLFRLNNIPSGKLDHINGNYFIGSGAGQSNTTGYRNIAIGQLALRSNSTTDWNIAIGDSALYYQTLSFGQNTAIGSRAMRLNTEGFYNTAIGSRALYSNTIGNFNVAIGNDALSANTTGYHNTAVGRGSQLSNITGYGNTSIGYYALRFNSDGTSNTGIGRRALYSNINGISNTSLGDEALYSNTSGDYNTARIFTVTTYT